MGMAGPSPRPGVLGLHRVYSIAVLLGFQELYCGIRKAQLSRTVMQLTPDSDHALLEPACESLPPCSTPARLRTAEYAAK